jgi:hypothetical protein
MWSKQKLDCKIYYRLYDFPIVYGSFLSTNSIASSGSFIQGVCIPNLYTISVEFTFFLCSTAGTPTINKLYFDASKLHQKWKGSQNMRHYYNIFKFRGIFLHFKLYNAIYKLGVPGLHQVIYFNKSLLETKYPDSIKKNASWKTEKFTTQWY